MVPVTAQVVLMKTGMTTRASATRIKSSLAFRNFVKLNRATASFSPLGPFAQSLDS